MIKKGFISGTLILILSILIFSMTGIGQQMAPEEMSPQEEVVVATVDGEEVYMQELEREANIQGIIMELQEQNPEFVEFISTSPEGQKVIEEFKRTQMNNLIERKLLENKAEEKDITLTEEDKNEFFEEQMEMIQQQQGMGEEEILEALSQQGIESMDEFQEMMIQDHGDQLREQKLLEEIVIDEVDITEEEARELYEEQQIPQEFDQIKDQLKLQLAREEYVEQLKEGTEIDIYEDEIGGQPDSGGMMMP